VELAERLFELGNLSSAMAVMSGLQVMMMMMVMMMKMKMKRGILSVVVCLSP
jgi:uncharacterized membrane protein YccC